MSISRTYLQLQQQIADELGGRTDLLSPDTSDFAALTSGWSPIQSAIQSAIAKWEREPFYFNEVYSQNLFSTAVGQELYVGTPKNLAAIGLAGNSPYMLKLHVLIGNNRYPLHPRTWNYLEDTSVNPSVTGQPIDYAVMANTIRLYPIPDGVYPITVSMTTRIANLANDNDSNVWTQDAFDLIRSEAKLILARETLFDDDLATRMELAIYGSSSAGGMWGKVPSQRGYLHALKAETTRRGRGRITPSFF